jgi:prevent-host-death family protein
MSDFGVLQAKNRFSELIERAENGEKITITRHGKPVVHFTKAEEDAETKRKRAHEALAWIRANRPKTGITTEEILEWIKEGRR